MLSRAALDHILEDEALTRGLGDPEARILIEWLVEEAELASGRATSDEFVQEQIVALCRRARTIGRFVQLCSNSSTRGAAHQLAAAERVTWPLPSGQNDPCEIMELILQSETCRPAA